MEQLACVSVEGASFNLSLSTASEVHPVRFQWKWSQLGLLSAPISISIPSVLRELNKRILLFR